MAKSTKISTPRKLVTMHKSLYGPNSECHPLNVHVLSTYAFIHKFNFTHVSLLCSLIYIRLSSCHNCYPQMHVTKGAKPPLESGYVQTGRHPNMNNYTPTVYALDCEMVSVYYVYNMSVLFHNAVTKVTLKHQQFGSALILLSYCSGDRISWLCSYICTYVCT